MTKKERKEYDNRHETDTKTLRVALQHEFWNEVYLIFDVKLSVKQFIYKISFTFYTNFKGSWATLLSEFSDSEAILPTVTKISLAESSLYINWC